jgi:hypothetical protein
MFPQSYYVGVDAYGNPVAITTGAMSPNLAGSIVAPQVPVGTIPNSTNASSTNAVANNLLELATLHNTLLVGSALIGTGQGDGTTSADPTTTIKRPWIDEPDGAVPFDPEIAVALPPAATIPTQYVIVTLTVPQGYDGVIKGFNWNFTGGGFVQGDGSLQAQILRNGVPVRNYDNILTERGTYQTARPISPLRIYSLDVIQLVVNHLANGLLSGNLLGGFVGYFYPSAS